MRPSFLNVLGNYLALKKEQWQDADSLHENRLRRLIGLLRCAEDTNHYGKIFRDGLTAEDIARDISLAPLCDRQSLKASPRDFVCRGTDPRTLSPSVSSGSSGSPVKVFHDRRTREMQVAMLALAMTESGWAPHNHFAEISFTDHSSFPMLSRLGLFRKTHLPVFEKEESTYRRLRRLRPDILGWYPSVLRLLASLNDESAAPLRLKRIFCGAETLIPSVRRHLEESFSCKVYNKYASAEFGTMAWECPEERRMHVSPTCLLEIIDGQGKPKRNGVGEVVVTGLVNRSMPLIRYRLGDRASFGKECPCGRALQTLDSLEGRKEDVLMLPSGRTRSAFVIGDLEGVPGFTKIRNYQIVQQEPDHIVLRHVPRTPLKGSEREALISAIRRGCLGEDVLIELEEAEEIPRGRTGKLCFFRSELKGGSA